MTKRKQWYGNVPSHDDFGDKIADQFIDGATFAGPWAIMTPATFARAGVGLGTGRGQWYRLESDGIWYKVLEP